MSRIAIVAPLKSWGGLERLVVSIANEFIARGHDVEFVRVRGGEIPYPAELSPRIRITELRTRSKLDGMFKVAAWMRRERPEALLTLKDHSAQLCIMARRIARVPIRVVPVVSNMLSYVARRSFQRRMVRRLYPAADRVVALSEGVAEDLGQTFGVPRRLIDVIYQPVVTPDMDTRAGQPLEHPWFRETDNIPIVVGAGRLTHQKNFHLLIEAFAILRANRTARLVILGEGVERQSLEQKAHVLGVSEWVDMPGAVPDPVPYMRSSNLFVLSSRYEGFGNVVAEALAAGAPVVSVNCPSGPAEILENGRWGRLVPVGDPDALATAMEKALDGNAPRVPSDSLDRFRVPVVTSQYLAALGVN